MLVGGSLDQRGRSCGDNGLVLWRLLRVTGRSYRCRGNHRLVRMRFGTSPSQVLRYKFSSDSQHVVDVGNNLVYLILPVVVGKGDLTRKDTFELNWTS